MDILEKLLVLVTKRYPAFIAGLLIALTIGSVGFYIGMLYERTHQQERKIEEQKNELYLLYKYDLRYSSLLRQSL